MFDLAFIWAGLIAFAVLAYVVLDGFDLGVGILFPLFPERHDRDLMTNSIAPVWDGNETWLVLGGGGLLAVFPVVYATVLPALYMPIILMLPCPTLNVLAHSLKRPWCGRNIQKRLRVCAETWYKTYNSATWARKSPFGGCGRGDFLHVIARAAMPSAIDRSEP